MDKILIVTGGSRGIGASTAIRAARAGYAVVVNYRDNADAAAFVVKSITEAGGRAIAVKADISKEEEVIRLFEETDRQLGRVTALVNNAGIMEKKSLVLEMDVQRLMRIFSTNLIAPFLCSREAIKRMSVKMGGGGGAIVNVSSTATRHGGPFEYIDYAASKGALDVFTIGLAKEVAGEGIRVNAVRPGIVQTEIHASGEPGRLDRLKSTIPMQRVADPDEVAKAILWLLSDDASYCAGTILDVTGGR